MGKIYVQTPRRDLQPLLTPIPTTPQKPSEIDQDEYLNNQSKIKSKVVELKSFKNQLRINQNIADEKRVEILSTIKKSQGQLGIGEISEEAEYRGI